MENRFASRTAGADQVQAQLPIDKHTHVVVPNVQPPGGPASSEHGKPGVGAVFGHGGTESDPEDSALESREDSSSESPLPGPLPAASVVPPSGRTTT